MVRDVPTRGNDVSAKAEAHALIGQMVERGLAEDLPPAPVVADAAYGDTTDFREGLTARGFSYVLGIKVDLLELVSLAKIRWRIERDFEKLKPALYFMT